MSVLWSTLSGNAGSSTGGDLGGGYGVQLKATIVANSASRGGDCEFPPYDRGYNLADDSSCGFRSANQSRNGTPAGLDPSGLQSNGGLTQTIALLSSGPAVDYVPVSTGPPKIDQRLLSRPDAGESFADIGAYELQ
jgi:hypothetical protein